MVQTLQFNITEYIEDFELKAEELSKTKLADAPDPAVINQQVEGLINEYYAQVGQYPKPHVLSLLADYILVNELKNKDVDKVANNDYPILSDIQLKRRNRKQVTMQDSTLDYLNTKYHKNLDSMAKKNYKNAEY